MAARIECSRCREYESGEFRVNVGGARGKMRNWTVICMMMTVLELSEFCIQFGMAFGRCSAMP